MSMDICCILLSSDTSAPHSEQNSGSTFMNMAHVIDSAKLKKSANINGACDVLIKNTAVGTFFESAQASSVVKPTHSHAFDIAFELETACEDGETATPQQLRSALIKRIFSLEDSELLEAIGAPFDTHELESA